MERSSSTSLTEEDYYLEDESEGEEAIDSDKVIEKEKIENRKEKLKDSASVVEEVVLRDKPRMSSGLRKARTRSRDRLGKFFTNTITTRAYSSENAPLTDTCVISDEVAYDIWFKMLDKATGMPLSSHRVKKKMISNSFSGTEACTWLNENIIPNLPGSDPISLAQQLLTRGYFEPISNKNKIFFEAGNINFYLLKSPTELPSKKKK